MAPMIGFAIGMVAFLLWLLVLWGVTALARSSPGHPFLSINRFRAARRKMAPARTIAEEPNMETAPETSEHELLPFASPLAESTLPQADESGDLTEPGDDDWDRFIAAMKTPAGDPVMTIPDLEPLPVEGGLETIGLHPDSAATPQDKSQPKRASSARKPTKRPSGPRKQGRMTYVLVDKDGKPDLG
jgi:hypothetical protein